MLSSYSLGTYRANEQGLIITSRLYKPNASRRGVMHFHGAGGNALSILNPVFTPKAEAIAEANFPFCSFDYGDPTVVSGTNSGPHNWGNAHSIFSAALGMAFMQAGGANGQFGSGAGAATNKCFLYGGSMGALTALNFALSNATPSSVIAGIVLSVPVLDLDDIYQNDIGGWRSEVGDAYFVTHPTALPDLATHSPVAYSAGDKAKLSMPIRIWAASDDPFASTTTECQAWAATVGANVVVSNLGAVGHSGLTIPPNDLVAFFNTNDV